MLKSTHTVCNRINLLTLIMLGQCHKYLKKNYNHDMFFLVIQNVPDTASISRTPLFVSSSVNVASVDRSCISTKSVDDSELSDISEMTSRHV